MQIIDAHQDLLARLENSVWTVWLANQALQVNQACPATTHQFLCHPMDVVVGVHPVHPDLQARLDPLDQLATKDNQAIQVQQAKMAALEDPAIQEAQASPANKAVPVQPAMLVAMLKLDKKEIMDHPVPLVNLVPVAPTANVVVLANLAPQAYLVHPAPLAQVANRPTKVPLVHEARPAVLARMPNIVHVPDVPRRSRKSRKPKWNKIWGFGFILFFFGTQFSFYVKK